MEHGYIHLIGKLPLVAPWTDIEFSETKPDTEEVNTMLPTPNALRGGQASWEIWKADSKLVDMRVENPTTVKSTTEFRMFLPTIFIYGSKTSQSSSSVNKKSSSKL